MPDPAVIGVLFAPGPTEMIVTPRPASSGASARVQGRQRAGQPVGGAALVRRWGTTWAGAGRSRREVAAEGPPPGRAIAPRRPGIGRASVYRLAASPPACGCVTVRLDGVAGRPPAQAWNAFARSRSAINPGCSVGRHPSRCRVRALEAGASMLTGNPSQPK